MLKRKGKRENEKGGKGNRKREKKERKSRKGGEGEKEKRETRIGKEERGKKKRKRGKRGKKKGRKRGMDKGKEKALESPAVHPLAFHGASRCLSAPVFPERDQQRVKVCIPAPGTALESSLPIPHQGLASSMGLETPLEQLEGQRKVLEACQHSQSISKSRK